MESQILPPNSSDYYLTQTKPQKNESKGLTSMKQRLKQYQYSQGKTSESFNDIGNSHVCLKKKKKPESSACSATDSLPRRSQEVYASYSLISPQVSEKPSPNIPESKKNGLMVLSQPGCFHEGKVQSGFG